MRSADLRWSWPFRLGLGVLLSATAGGCADDNDYIGTSSVIAFGQITTQGGAPYSGARVFSDLDHTCELIPRGGPFVTTTNDGRYRYVHTAPFSEQTVCLHIWVLFGDGASLDSVKVDSANVLLKNDRRPGPPDSVRIDVRLPIG